MVNITDDRGFNQMWRDSKATRIRAQRRCDYIISQMQVNASRTVLEIGCGTGWTSFRIAQKTGMKVLGTDLCAPFIKEATEKFQLPNLHYEILNFHEPERLKGQRFDYIVGDGILHHLYYRLDEALRNMSDLLENHGKIIFLEPNIFNPYVYLIFSYSNLRQKALLEPGEMAFSRAFVEEKLLQAGYRDIGVEYRDFLLPGIPDFLIRPSIAFGRVLEQIPLVKMLSQSIFICASRSSF